MIRADLIVEGAAEVVTCAGRSFSTPASAGVIHDGAVACEGERIVFVGPAEACRREVELSSGGHRLDARRGVVLPGFVDAHTHLPFGGWREDEFEMRLSGASYAEIVAGGGGILSTVRATRKLSAADLADIVRCRLDQALLAGTTTIEAKSGYGLSIGSEVVILEALALCSGHPADVVPTFLGAHVVPEEFRMGRRSEYVRQIVREMIPRIAKERLARFCDVFADEVAFTLEETREILEAAQAHGLGARLHAEQLTRTGAARLGISLGAYSVDHLERVTGEDVAALAAAWNRSRESAPADPRAPVAILLPGATHFLRETARPPARALIEAGVPVALATDFNPGSSPCLAMAPVLNLACLLFGMSPDEAIVAATRNGALSLGLEERVGSLEAGKQADLVVWGIPDRRHLAYRFGPVPCTAVVKRGKIVAQNGRLSGRAAGSAQAALGPRGESMLTDLSGREFLAKLSSADPTPGGGSASALAAAQGAALLEMVAAITLKSEKYAASRGVIEPIQARALALRADLIRLVDRDAEAYEKVLAAGRLPRQTEEEKERRKEARRKAILFAAEVPLETASLACAVATAAAQAAPHVNPAAASDLLVAALLAVAAVSGAVANVRINLDALKSDPFVATANERIAALTQDAGRSLDTIRGIYPLAD